MSLHTSALSCFFIFKSKTMGVIFKSQTMVSERPVTVFFQSILLFHTLKRLLGGNTKCLFQHFAQLCTQ